jgi:hypothetical protein
MSRRASFPFPDPLASWLALDFTRPERSYNPEIQGLLSGLLSYPRERVVVEDRHGGGYPDFLLRTREGDPWVVGEFKLDDGFLLDPRRAESLWEAKKKYVTGTTRYVPFLTSRRLQLRDSKGAILRDVDLTRETTQSLREKLQDLSEERANHDYLWSLLVQGKLPHSYIHLDEEGTKRLKEELTVSFLELTEAAERALKTLEEGYREYRDRLEDARRNLSGALEETRRPILARLEGEYPEALKALFEKHLPRFADQYGRELEEEETPTNPRTLEALPWPREPREDLLGKLSALYGDLEALARESRDNPSEWFLREVEDRIDRREALPLSAPRFDLDFRKWQDQVPRIDLRVEGAVLKGSPHAELDLKDPDLARFVHLLLGLLEAETVGSEDLQKLLVPKVPEKYRNLLREYEDRERAFSGVRERFMATLEAVDEVVFDLFGLTPGERAHVKARLASFPLNRLRPRYPWEVGEPRPLRSYTEDRFR